LVVIGPLGGSGGGVPVGVKSLPQWCVFIDRDWLGRARLGSQHTPIGPVDITTANGHDSPGYADEPGNGRPGVVVAHGTHVPDDIRRWIAQARRDVQNADDGAGTMDVTHRG